MCYLFTDFVPDSTLRYDIGWLYIGIVIINLMCNFLLLFGNTIKSFKLLVRKIVFKIKASIKNREFAKRLELK